MFAREALSNSVIRQPNELLAWSCGLVAHRLEVATHPSENVIQSCINALAVISQHAVGVPEAEEVKQTLFVNLPAIKTLLTDSRSIPRKRHPWPMAKYYLNTFIHRARRDSFHTTFGR